MKTLGLISLGLGGVGTAVGTGVALSYYYGGSTIKEYIEANKKENNKVFLTSTTAKLNDIKAQYKASKRTKPKKDGKDIPETEIVQWCEKAVNDKFSKEEDKDFEAILSWCYINTNSFEEELSGSGKSKITSTTHTEKVWQDAWTKYSTSKDVLNLKIIGHTKDADLNGADGPKGQQALMEWCKEKAPLGMYVDKAKEDFPRFAHWCTN